ncbi:MAG: branched-chain amino acid ABC transporter permease [Candidatus Hydrogenedentales bacterium]|jgi:branched-chain amino acid transport system permease protein
MGYIEHFAVVAAIYSVIAVSFNLVAGYTGQLSLAPAAFYGIGAYVVALMALRLQTPFLLNMGCAIVVCAIAGALVGIPSLRIRDEYFVIATFAFQVIVFSVLNNAVSLTGGPTGLAGIPSPVVLGWEISSRLDYLLLSGAFAAVSFWICKRLVQSPYGQVLKVIREDERYAQANGKNVAACKISIFTASAAITAAAGVIYAHYISFIDPSSFTIMESIFIISVVIIGGAGSLWGPVVGAIVLVSLPEILRFVGLPSSVAANMRQILYGGALVACMMWRPQGLIGEFSFRRNENS